MYIVVVTCVINISDLHVVDKGSTELNLGVDLQSDAQIIRWHISQLLAHLVREGGENHLDRKGTG